MPTYDYRCRDCGHEFEAVQSFSDDALTECPQCGGSLRKLFGNIGVAFKGSGFYKTDHGSRAKSSSSTASSDSGSSSGSGSGSEGAASTPAPSTPASAD